ncbi:outer membrane beta-barrel protein [Chitinophaga niabensis]|uniref:Outer membrane receptor proteins, mostly Fe transport n=1 Tax=Chitinophaga niabensis TaxID=536979 RepID=A0A1N6JUB0_9BACT|nr:outer membrane beta-barrel protein [Chitinophaga niabensis]SIO47958.1 Outer membrane receptor proteins, mostly Fe transport [Chitinophaga niabensis]
MNIKPNGSIATIFGSLCLLGCMLASEVKAQQPPSNKDTETGTVKGKVLQASNKEPIPFATIALLNEDDSTVVTGAAADERGAFIIKPVVYGSYIVRIGTMGFAPYFVNVKVNAERTLWELGTILLETGTRTLKEVTIVSQKKMFTMNKDSIIFTPDENFLPGGTGMELLEYVPGITIDANNNITMEGKDKVKFYVDDKPIALTGMDYNSYLNNLPSFMIERIEVLKVPPDPVEAEQALVEGRTNIRYINIITRKIQFRGYSAAFTAGMDSRRNLNAKMRYNLNLAPFQVTYFNNGVYNSDSSYLNRSYFPKVPGGDTSFLDQKNFRTSYNFNHNLNGRYELKITEKEKLRGSVTLGWTGDGSNSSNNSTNSDYTHKPTMQKAQDNINRRNGFRGVTDWNYIKEYEQREKKLEAGFNFTKNNGSGYGNNDYFYLLTEDTSLQRNKRRNGNFSMRGNFHFRQPLSDGKYYDLSSSMEMSGGSNLNLATRKNVNDIEMLPAPRLSTDYSDFNQNYAVSASYGKRSRKLGYNFTSRLGYTGSKSEEQYAGNRFNNETYEIRSSLGINYSPWKDHMANLRFNPGIQFFNQMALLDSLRSRVPFKYTNFSPGINFQYDYKQQQLTFNFNRNMDRPSPDQLNPFVNTSDSFNIRTGNPNLRPSFTKDYRMEYTVQIKSHQIKAGLEQQDASDIISRYTKVEYINDTTIINTSTFVNLASRKDRNFYLTLNSHFFKAIQNNKGAINMNISGGIRYYNTTTDGGEEGKDAVSDKFAHVEGWTSNLTVWAAYRIRVFSISVNGRYNGPRYYAQGKQEARFNSGLRGQVNLFKRKMNVSFTVENLFGSTVKNFYELTKDYEQFSNNRKNVRYLSLNITYNIRKFTKLGNKGPKDFEKEEPL